MHDHMLEVPSLESQREITALPKPVFTWPMLGHQTQHFSGIIEQVSGPRRGNGQKWGKKSSMCKPVNGKNGSSRQVQDDDASCNPSQRNALCGWVGGLGFWLFILP